MPAPSNYWDAKALAEIEVGILYPMHAHIETNDPSMPEWLPEGSRTCQSAGGARPSV
jgi:hypothetical protein